MTAEFWDADFRAYVMELLRFTAYMAANFPSTVLQFKPEELRRVLERELAADGTGPDEWIDGVQACMVTGLKKRTLRARAKGWFDVQRKGDRPEIRVTSASDKEVKPGSPWRYNKADCLAYGAANGVEPPRENENSRPNDKAARTARAEAAPPASETVEAAIARYAAKAA